MTNISEERTQEAYNASAADGEAEQISENLGEVLSSYELVELTFEGLSSIDTKLQDRIDVIKLRELPPVEAEIDDINNYINQRKQELEKAKNASVFIDDFSEEVEFHYSDHKAKFIEDNIKELLNKRYLSEKVKYKIFEELEELEARKVVCNKLIESYQIREAIENLYDYSQQVSSDIYFDIENFDSITNTDYDSVENWERSWSVLIEILGKANSYQLKIQELFQYFTGVKDQLEEKDPETKFVFDEMEKYPDLEPALQEVISDNQTSLLASMAALYELAANYEVNEDYLPEYRQNALGKINKLKSLILSVRTGLDNYKLEYRDFRKTINNIFVLLNKAIQGIESQQKLLKNMQEAKIKKIRDIITLISRSSPDALKNSADEISNLINKLYNMGASGNQVEALTYFFSVKAHEPVDEERKEDLIYGLNEERETMKITEIDQMCLVLGLKYDQRRGFYKDDAAVNPVSSQKPVQQKQKIPAQFTQTNPGVQLQPKKSKAGNLDFLGNMYLKEAQRSKGEWAAKSYLKAIEAFMKCAEAEDEMPQKLTFLKIALKAAKEAVVEKESGLTLYTYAQAYRELAFNHTPNLAPPGILKVGENFINAGKFYLKEENINDAQKAFIEANDVLQQAEDDPAVKAKMSSLKSFLS